MTDVTARAAVVKLSPGIYQLSTVLYTITIHGKHKGGRPHLHYKRRYTDDELIERNRVRAREKYHKRRERCEAMWRAIYALPDDERELWTR